jgi:DNA polymerase beta
MSMNQVILDNLKAMKSIEVKNKQHFKARAYDKVIKQISEIDTDIETYEDLDQVAGIGEGIKLKLKKIFEFGFLNTAIPEMANIGNIKSIEMFQTIMAVGAVKARELVEKHKMQTIEELRANPTVLNDKQQLGLKYYEDFLKRIPRHEMDKHHKFLDSVFKTTRYTFEISGSYRRGNANSGDIDVLVTSDDDPVKARESFKEIVETLKARKYLVDEFAYGSEKYLGVCRAPCFRSFRRIDIMYIPKPNYAFALLYFTGSQAFNIKMRSKALELGYTMNEHGMKNKKSGDVIVGKFETEKDVFDYLEMTFVGPTSR